MAAPSPLKIDEAVDYAIQVLAALADAHGAGIVHRDLKPANVFLSSGVGGAPLVKVLDFGVSKMVGAGSQRLTRTGAIVGTLAYMAPEQMLDARRVDGRADLWSAAVVLYESIARAHPFNAHASGPTVVTSILSDPVPPLRDRRPDVPPALEAAILRMLEKSPDRRFATAAEAAAALAPFASPRSRPVLDEIRRAPPPSGHAAPGLRLGAPRAERAATAGLAADAQSGEACVAAVRVPPRVRHVRDRARSHGGVRLPCEASIPVRRRSRHVPAVRVAGGGSRRECESRRRRRRFRRRHPSLTPAVSASPCEPLKPASGL